MMELLAVVAFCAGVVICAGLSIHGLLEWWQDYRRHD